MSLAELPHNHQRSVAITLRLMEERLEEVLQWLDQGERTTATRKIVDDVDPACCAELRRRLEGALKQVGAYYLQLDIPPEQQSLFRNCNEPAQEIQLLAGHLREVIENDHHGTPVTDRAGLDAVTRHLP